jgi:hypothetical protein
VAEIPGKTFTEVEFFVKVLHITRGCRKETRLPRQRRVGVNFWLDKLRNCFAAVAFAEEGEGETALRIAEAQPEPARQRISIVEALNTAFAAVAFAEENSPEIARQILSANKKGSFAAAIGLNGVRVWRAVVPVSEPSFLEVIGLAGVNVRLGVLRL